MQIGDKSHKMSKLFSGKDKKKKTSLVCRLLIFPDGSKGKFTKRAVL